MRRLLSILLALVLDVTTAAALTVRGDDLWLENHTCPQGWRWREFDDAKWLPVPYPWTRIWPIDWPLDADARPIWGTVPRHINCLRRTFTLDALPPEPATLHVWVDDDYDLYLNGIPVGSSNDHMGELPGETYDVTPLLRLGKNVIALQVRDNGGVMGVLFSLQMRGLPEPPAGLADRVAAVAPWLLFAGTVVAAVVAIVFLRRMLRRLAPTMARLPDGILITATVALTGGTGAVFALDTFYRSHRDMPLAVWNWPSLGLAITLLVGLALVRSGAKPVVDSEAPVWREGWWLGGILLLALALRTYQLDSIPPGFFQDEATNGNDALRLGQLGEAAIWSESVGGRPTLFLYLLLGALRLFGVSYLSLKVLPVALGIAGVLAVYALGRQTFGRRTALWAAFLLAVARWDIHYSRMAWEAICVPAFACAGFALLVDGLRDSKRAPFSLFAGASVLAVGLYTYAAYRAIAAVAVVFCLATLWSPDRSALRRHRLGLAVAGVAALGVAMPLLRFAWEHPEFYWERYAEVSLTRYIAYYQAPEAWLHQFGKGLLALTAVGDEIVRHNLPFEPHLDRLTGALLLLGMATAFSVRHHLGLRLTWSWLLVFTAFATLTMDGPHATRLLGTAPPAVLLAAFGATQLLAQLRSWRPMSVMPLAVALATALAGINTYQYFVTEAQHPAADLEYNVTGRSLCEHLRRQEVLVDLHWSSDISYWADGQCLFLARGKYNLGETIKLEDVLPGNRFENPGRPTILVVGPEFLTLNRPAIPLDPHGVPQLSLAGPALVGRDRQHNPLYYLYAIGLPQAADAG